MRFLCSILRKIQRIIEEYTRVCLVISDLLVICLRFLIVHKQRKLIFNMNIVEEVEKK